MQTLNLLNELIRLNIGRLKFSPAMDVEGLLELVGEELGLLLLLEQLLLKQVDLALKVRDALGLLLGVNELTFAVFDLIVEVQDVLHFLQVVDFALFQR